LKIFIEFAVSSFKDNRPCGEENGRSGKRPITKWYLILFVDAFFIKLRRNGIVEKESVYVVMGLQEEGIKEVIAYYLSGGSGESSVVWREVLTDLYDRELKEPLLNAPDNLQVLKRQ